MVCIDKVYSDVGTDLNKQTFKIWQNKEIKQQSWKKVTVLFDISEI